MRVRADEVQELDLILDTARDMRFSVLTVQRYPEKGFIALTGVAEDGCSRTVFLAPKALIAVERMFAE